MCTSGALFTDVLVVFRDLAQQILPIRTLRKLYLRSFLVAINSPVEWIFERGLLDSACRLKACTATVSSTLSRTERLHDVLPVRGSIREDAAEGLGSLDWLSLIDRGPAFCFDLDLTPVSICGVYGPDFQTAKQSNV